MTATEVGASSGQRVGAATAARAVVDDVSALVRAEVTLAKAELSQAVHAKATGIGLLVGAAVLGWLMLQGLLITIGLALALVVPGWAAALIVTAVLALGAGVLALVARRKLAGEVGLRMTKANVEEDIQWTKAHLPGRR